MHITHLSSLFPLQGQSVVDIGAGDGIYSRDLHDAGAHVTAVEVDAQKVASARAALPADIDVRLGTAEALPVSAASQTLACFFFSLHHVPADCHAAAFDEAYRVLRPGGRLHVVEPYPHGSMFDVVRLVEDETAVRTHSHKVLNRLGDNPRFDLADKTDYVLTREFPTFDFFVAKIVQADPDRSATFPSVAGEMRRAYDAAVDMRDGRCLLHQPCAAFHFTLDK